MGNRLSKIVTRTGDQGTTGLGNGQRIEKSSQRIRCLGILDEVNASIGLLRTQVLPPRIDRWLARIQHHLFDLGGEMCLPGQALIKDDYVLSLEQWLEQLNADLPPLKEFILPGGSLPAAHCHMARTICRRAEVEIATLAQQESVNKHCLQYINRLSDFLFVCARALNKHAGHHDVLWAGPPEEV